MENKRMGKQQKTDENDEIVLKDLLMDLLYRWRWFAISLSVCLLVGFFVARSSVKYYGRSATILIKDKKQGGTSVGDLLASSNFAHLGSSAVDDELQVLKSRTLMMQVMERLNIGTSYTMKSGMRPVDLYSAA